MTIGSRGISSIQEKATGKTMKKDPRKKMLKGKDKGGLKLSKTSLGPAESAGGIPGMMACGGKVKGYAKGGRIDGCATKGHTKGKMV